MLSQPSAGRRLLLAVIAIVCAASVMTAGPRHGPATGGVFFTVTPEPDPMAVAAVPTSPRRGISWLARELAAKQFHGVPNRHLFEGVALEFTNTGDATFTTQATDSKELRTDLVHAPPLLWSAGMPKWPPGAVPFRGRHKNAKRWDTLAGVRYRRSSGGAGKPTGATLAVDLAIFVPQRFETCTQDNLWHTVFERVLPTLHAVHIEAALHGAPRSIAVVMDVGHCVWRGMTAPYAFADNATMHGHIFRSLRQLTFPDGSSPRVIFVPLHSAAAERWWNSAWGRASLAPLLRDLPTDERSAFDAHIAHSGPSFRFKRLLRGTPASCFGEYTEAFVKERGWGAEQWPMTARSAPCDGVIRHLRHLALLELLPAGASGFAQTGVAVDEVECPRIVAELRPDALNGRSLAHYNRTINDLLLTTGKRGCPRGRTVVTVDFGKLSLQAQAETVASATVLLTARGAGQINALFLRDGAGFISIGAYRPGYPLFIEDDATPWTPWMLVRERQHFAFGMCRATRLRRFARSDYWCGCGRTNDCDLDCPPRYVVGLVQQVLSRVGDAIRGSGPQTTHVVPRPDLLPVTEASVKGWLHVVRNNIRPPRCIELRLYPEQALARGVTVLPVMPGGEHGPALPADWSSPWALADIADGQGSDILGDLRGAKPARWLTRDVPIGSLLKRNVWPLGLLKPEAVFEADTAASVRNGSFTAERAWT